MESDPRAPGLYEMLQAGTVWYEGPHPTKVGHVVLRREDGHAYTAVFGLDDDPEKYEKGNYPKAEPAPARFTVPDDATSSEEEETVAAEPDEPVVPLSTLPHGAPPGPLRAWADDVYATATGSGALRIIFCGNAASERGAPPTGAVVASQRGAGVGAAVDPGTFDPHHIGDGMTLYVVPPHAEANHALDAADLPAVLAEVRDAADFRLKTSWVGVYSEDSVYTGWRLVYYVVVRDGDIDASTRLFDRIEAEHPRIGEILDMPELQEARDASRERRHAVVRRVLSAVGAPFVPTDAKEMPVCDFASVADMSYDTYAKGMVYIPDADVVLTESRLDDGLVAFWPATMLQNQTYMHFWPTHTPLGPPLRSSLVEDEHYTTCLSRRDSDWQAVEIDLGATYGLIARHFKPRAVAVSRARHENPFAGL